MAAMGLNTAAGLPARAAVEGQAAAALRLPSLRRNFSWTLAGNLFYAACQWGMLIVLAKLGDTPEMVGQFALGLAVAAPAMLFANLQLRAILAADAGRHHRFADSMALRLWTTSAALAAIAAIALATPAWRPSAGVIIAVGLAKALESISDVLYGALQQAEDMGSIARSLIARGVLSLVGLGGAVAATGSVLWGTLALAAGWALVLALYDMPRAAAALGEGESIRPRWDPARQASLARQALPLGVTMLLISLHANIPRYFLGLEPGLGDRALGVFSALSYLAVIGNTVVAALGQSSLPRLARYHAQGDGPAFRRLLLILAALALGLGLAGVVAALTAGPEVLAAIYRPEYASQGALFGWLMVGAGLSYLASVFGYAATASRRIAYQPAVLAPVVAVSLASCAVLVPRYGLLGAAMSTVLSSGVNALAYAALQALPSDRGRP